MERETHERGEGHLERETHERPRKPRKSAVAPAVSRCFCRFVGLARSCATDAVFLGFMASRAGVHTQFSQHHCIESRRFYAIFAPSQHREPAFVRYFRGITAARAGVRTQLLQPHSSKGRRSYAIFAASLHREPAFVRYSRGLGSKGRPFVRYFRGFTAARAGALLGSDHSLTQVAPPLGAAVLVRGYRALQQLRSSFAVFAAFRGFRVPNGFHVPNTLHRQVFGACGGLCMRRTLTPAHEHDGGLQNRRNAV